MHGARLPPTFPTDIHRGVAVHDSTNVFFHVGMPKTGTSSIQTALLYHLAHPGFQYVSFGEINGSCGIGTLVDEAPEAYVWNRLFGLEGAPVARLDRMSRVFSFDSVECHPYDRTTLLHGCVVRDFLHRIGAGDIHVDPLSENDSLRVEACKLMYIYNRHCFPRGADSRWLAERAFPLGHLSQLPSAPLRLHPLLVQHMAPPVATQRAPAGTPRHSPADGSR